MEINLLILQVKFQARLNKHQLHQKQITQRTNTSEVTLLTDEEIDNAKTVGDVKKVFGKLVDNYKKHAVEIGEKIPESGKEAYNAQVEPALKSMETVRESF